MVTVEDIRDASRASGFRHVSIRYKTYQGRDRVPHFRAQAGSARDPATGKALGRCSWFGRRDHRVAEDAAQEYCDYMNGSSAPSNVSLRTAKHPTRRGGRKVPPEVAAAYGTIRDYRARVKADEGVKNFIYLVGEEGCAFVKIGESAKPPARPGELQTGNARTLVLLASYEAATLRGADKLVHQQFVDSHHQNEWFRPTQAVLSHFGITDDEFLRRCGGTTMKEVKAA